MKIYKLILVCAVVGGTWSIGCHNSMESDLDIAGGRAESGYPSVKMLLSDKSQVGICSGVAVSHNAILIAAHCVKDGTIDWSVRSPDTGKDAEKIIMWTQLMNRQRMSLQDASRDLAVLIYPPHSVNPPYAVVAQSLPKVDDEVTLVGFGATHFGNKASREDGSVGRKNSGANTLSHIHYSDCEDEGSICKERVLITKAGVRADGSLDRAAAAP